MKKLVQKEFSRLIKLAGYRLLLGGSAGVGLLCGFFVIYNSKAGALPVLKTLLVWPLLAAVQTGIYAAVFWCRELKKHNCETDTLHSISRGKLFLAKMSVFCIGLLPVLYVPAITAAVLAGIKGGFGMETDGEGVTEWIKMVLYSVLGYLALGGYFSFFATLIKNPAGTIAAGMAGVYVQMILVSHFRNADAPLLKLSFLYQLNQFLDWETFQDKIFLVVVLATFLITMAAALLFYKRAAKSG